jgi:hypothetical protein
MGMKLLRSVALFVAILIPSYAIAEASRTSATDCCYSGSKCCHAGCPLCKH